MCTLSPLIKELEASSSFLLPMYDVLDTECLAAGYMGSECVLYR